MQSQNLGGETLRGEVQRWLDWPPLWTVAGVVAIWGLSWLLPLGFAGSYVPGLSLASAVLGLALMARAAWQMWRQKTTVNPRGQPTALVTDGIFAISRNPIYLGDALILLAATFWWDSLAGFVVIGGFIWVVTERFIKVEEGRLAEAFGETAAEWFSRVRRWI